MRPLYKIEYSPHFDTHFVRVALGPWPFKNWSLDPVFSSRSRIECEAWVERAKFRASPAGASERAREDQQRKFQDEARRLNHNELLKQGWLYNDQSDEYSRDGIKEVRAS